MNVQEYLAKKHNASQNAQKPLEAAVIQQGINTGQQMTSAAEGQHKPQNNPFLTGGNYKAIYRDVFDFHKRWYPAQEGLEYWQKVCVDAERIAAAHDNDEFACEMLANAHLELEREMLKRRENAKRHI